MQRGQCSESPCRVEDSSQCKAAVAGSVSRTIAGVLNLVHESFNASEKPAQRMREDAGLGLGLLV